MRLIVKERNHLILYPVKDDISNQVVPLGTYEVRIERVSGAPWWVINLPGGIKCGKVVGTPEMEELIIKG
jgi:hypothetical protein